MRSTKKSRLARPTPMPPRASLSKHEVNQKKAPVAGAKLSKLLLADPLAVAVVEVPQRTLEKGGFAFLALRSLPSA